MFELLNVKWGEPTFGTPSGTVTWSSELGGGLVLNNGATDESIDETLSQALQAWEDVAAVSFVEDTTDPMFTFAAAPIDIEFAGVTVFQPDLPGLNTTESADVFFNSQYLWSDNGGTGSTDFYAVALHEIGHIIGLDHPEDPSQIMNAVIQTDTLGDGDIRGAQFVYGTDGDDVPLEQVARADDGDSGGGGGGGGGGGLLVGLLALLASVFTGGGALVAMAAGRIAGATVDEDDSAAASADEATAVAALQWENAGTHSHDHGHAHGEEHVHGVRIEDFALLPGIDFTQRPNPCGCVGLCEHIIDREGEPGPCDDDLFV